MTNQRTIDDLRRVANMAGRWPNLHPLRDKANYYADSLQPKEGEKTLQEWIGWAKTKRDNNSPSLFTKNEKEVLRGLFNALQKLYETGRCHGSLESTNVLISTKYEVDSHGVIIRDSSKDPIYTISKVKLVDLRFLPCTSNNMDKDFKDLAKLLRLFHPLPPDVTHLVDHLNQPNKFELKPVYIFNPVFLWDTNKVFMVIEYLTNMMVRYQHGLLSSAVYEASKAAAKKCYPNGWSSLFKAKFSKNATVDCLVRSMRDLYGHPPRDSNGVLQSQEEVTRTFLKSFPEFLPELVIQLLLEKAVKPGDPVDSNRIGRSAFYGV